jgi:recombination associated protein RdgC
MFFKNLTYYRLPKGWLKTAGTLEDILATKPLVPPTGMSVISFGWVPVGPSDEIVYGLEKHLLIALGIEKKMLPSSVVNREVEKRKTDFEKARGFAPGRKMVRELKEQVISELLPKAFTTVSAVRAWLDMEKGIIVVDTSSAGKAEELISRLRETLNEEFAVTMFEPQVSPSSAMTTWLATGQAPAGFAIAEESELVSTDAAKSTVRYLRHDLTGQGDIEKHIREGKQVTKLALQTNNGVTFILTDKLQIKKVTLPVGEEDGEDTKVTENQFDADFTLMTGMLRPLISGLNEAVEVQEPDDAPASADSAEEEQAEVEEAE